MLLLHFLMIFYEGYSRTLGDDKLSNIQDKLFKTSSILFFYGTIFLSQFFSIILSNWSNLISLLIGGIIFLGGFVLRRYAIHTLDYFFTMEIGIRKNHKIIKTGPYKLIRHPSYTGYLLMIIGFLIAVMHWLSIIPLLFVIGFLNKRMQEEEKMLLSHFQDDYKQYASQSYKLIPFVY